MTLPFERARAVRRTEKFLLGLTDPKQIPRVPKEIRDYAKHLLRHYPTLNDLEMVQLGWDSNLHIEPPFKVKDSFFGELE